MGEEERLEFKGLRETRGRGSFSNRTKTGLSNEYGKILPKSQQLNGGWGNRETEDSGGASWGRKEALTRYSPRLFLRAEFANARVSCPEAH